MTEKQIQALRIVQEHGPMTPSHFAFHMWPDSPARLTGLNRPAGRMLNRLHDMKMLTSVSRGCSSAYILTERGFRELEKLL